MSVTHAPLHTAVAARPPLSGRSADASLLRRHARTRDPELRRQLAERYLPLARYAASQYAHSAEPFDDLVQVASIGLLNAIDRYDPENGAAFSSYALPTITGELRRYFRDRSWTVRPPRTLQEHALKVEKATEQLRSRTERSPTVDEIAGHSGLTVEEVLEAREALSARYGTSLSSTGSGDEGDHLGLEERLGVVDDGFRRADQRVLIDTLSAVLTPREREVVRLRFDEDRTQSEIGEAVGLSQMHISRVLRTALQKLSAAAAAA